MKAVRRDAHRGAVTAVPRRYALYKDMTLDPIDPDLVGCVKGGVVAASRDRLLGPWAAPIDAWRGRSGHIPRHRDESINQGARDRKRSFRTTVRRRTSGRETLTELPMGIRVHAACSILGVPKTELLLRVIFDARPANARHTPFATSLSLFILDDLARVLGRSRRYLHHQR
jgi:hypothetical protein